ncbi:MAG TPA: hypothetical protein VKU42_12640 [Candidatus Angelobacter sp.]|nr:hypothetical protein [Candidatus Angelobacter sp.]
MVETSVGRCSKVKGQTHVTGKGQMQENTVTDASAVIDATAVIKEVRRRYRICNYLFKTGAAWIFAGYAIALFTKFQPRWNQLWFVVVTVGFGIFTAAFALTLAIYRCPVCDKYLSRYRPDKRKCPQCGTQVRESSARP